MNAASVKTFAVHAAVDGTQTKSGEIQQKPKTPVSFLQEICAKRQILPKYELLKAEGQVHDPQFVLGVTVEDLTATGSGRSKKYAKHLAAKNLLDRLVTSGRHLLFHVPGETNDEALAYIQSLMPEPPVETTATNPDENQMPLNNTADNTNPNIVSKTESESSDVLNPVGTLQEVCMRKQWPPAYYEMLEELGQPHNRVYKFKVHLGPYNETGAGRTKRLAKRIAALKMLKFLVELESQEKTAKSTLMRVVQDDDLQLKFATIMSDMGHKVKPVAPDEFNDVKAFFEHLKRQPSLNVEYFAESARQTSGDVIKTVNFVHILTQVSQIGQFEVKYADLTGRTFVGEFQCLAQLCIKTPLVVVHGTGRMPEDAKQSAAFNALEYLKLFTSNQ